MLAEVALSVSQYKVVDPPTATLDGLAGKERMVGSDPDDGGVGGGVEYGDTATEAEAEDEFVPLKASST
jgi:hypothetical protein